MAINIVVIVIVYVIKYMTLQIYIRHACPQDCGFQNMPSFILGDAP